MTYKDINERRKYQRELLVQRREEYLKNKSCYMCGSVDNLEIDHRDPSQKTHGTIWSRSEARREQELAKCDPLCRPCHKLKTLLMDTYLVPHGTVSAHRHGCRCQKCKKAWNKFMRHYRSK